MNCRGSKRKYKSDCCSQAEPKKTLVYQYLECIVLLKISKFRDSASLNVYMRKTPCLGRSTRKGTLLEEQVVNLRNENDSQPHVRMNDLTSRQSPIYLLVWEPLCIVCVALKKPDLQWLRKGLIKFSCQQKEWKMFCVLERNTFPTNEDTYKISEVQFLSYRTELKCFHTTFVLSQLLSRNDLSIFLSL